VPTTFADSPTRSVSGANGIEYAWRETGEGATPVVLFPALPGEPRQLGPSAHRRFGGDQACHHVRQRRSRCDDRDDVHNDRGDGAGSPSPSSTRWTSVRPICSDSR
jgi:hypothetical protein